MTATGGPLGDPEVLLVRFGELALKGGNRRRFERVLDRNLVAALSPITPVRVLHEYGRLILIPERRIHEAARRAAEVFGVKSVSPAWSCDTTPEAVTGVARAVFRDWLARTPEARDGSFRIRVRRAEKDFPIESVAFERQLGEELLVGDAKLPVSLKHADHELGIELRTPRSYVFLERFPAPGGLPVGTIGRALCMLSGGIDSPVAAWLAMKRGCQVDFVSFHSFPYLGEGSRRKVRALATQVSRYQGPATLHVVPFAETQEEIRDRAPESYRTVLYRRMMARISDALAIAEGCGALVTGDCLGQVASQTMENMGCIDAASSTLVLRPLVAYDKEEIIRIARRIGTYPLSKQPEPDCCTVFQPVAPVIRGWLEKCLRSEEVLDVDGLVTRALAGTERVALDPED